MKKTIVTFLLSSGIAAAAPLTLPSNTDFTWIPGRNADGIGTGASAEIMQQFAAAVTNPSVGNTDLVGWFGGTGQNYAQSDYNDITVADNASFTFKSRPALSGEYVALGVELTEKASSITLSFSNDKKVGYSLWSYDAATATATELFATTGLTTAGSVNVTYDTTEVDPSTLFVVWTANPSTGAEGGNTQVTISNISLSYTPADSSPLVPEPATATLGLLALCGLTARRRRK